MKKQNSKSLKLNKKLVSNLDSELLTVKGGISGGHTDCLPTTLRTGRNCVYTTDCDPVR